MNYRFLKPQVLDVNLGTLLLRLIFGGLFIYHGYVKLMAFDQILPMFGDIIGIGTKLSLILVVFAEFFCGIFVTLGLFTRLSIVPIFMTMSIAFFIAHAHDSFHIKELAFTFWLLSFVIFIFGGGKYSLDWLIFSEKEPKGGF